MIPYAQTSGKPKIRLSIGDRYRFVYSNVHQKGLHTVCEEANCPNIYECWNRGTATLMILGDTCTRACGFCSVKTGKPKSLNPNEPLKTALAVQEMKLKHVVITSVDRDDLINDYGASVWAETIRVTRELNPNCTIEVLTPDFKNYQPSLLKVFEASPDIFSHNVECVERVSKQVRTQSIWQRSLDVLKQSVQFGLLTKTSMMVGLGETNEEVVATMKQIVDLGVKIFTIGQYLQPTKQNLAVDRYVSNDEFNEYKKIGLTLGFSIIESGPLVRSSYHADEQAKNIGKI